MVVRFFLPWERYFRSVFGKKKKNRAMELGFEGEEMFSDNFIPRIFERKIVMNYNNIDFSMNHFSVICIT